MIKILHYAPNVGKGSLLEAYITDLVHGTQDVAEVRVAYNYAEAQKQLKASKPDIVQLPGNTVVLLCFLPTGNWKLIPPTTNATSPNG